jgi:hypothetical protein
MKRKLIFALAALPALILAAIPSRFAQPQAPSAGRSRGRALLVGVNEYQTKGINPTPGSIEDAMAIGKLIQEKGWFNATEVKTLLGPQATSANIEREFRQWLIGGTSPGDRAFFLYSGHGTQTPDDDGDERKTDPNDTMDEVIAPYDVNVLNGRLTNIIIDDQFNDWIEQLGGRSVVMVFDSCHSGTVTRGLSVGGGGTARLGPRYLPTPDQWNWGKSGATRSMGDGYAVSDGPPSRLLTLPVDEDRVMPNSTLTILSAAKSYQSAWPLRTPQGGVRGAFSYFIEQTLRSGNPTLRRLREDVAINIKRAQQQKVLSGEQEPDFEISSPSLMDDQPLFSARAPAQLPMLSPGFTNTASKISLAARLGYLKNGAFQTNRNVFCFGEEVGYRIQTNSPGYLYLIVFSRNDVVTLIYPGKGDKEYFEAGAHSLDGFPVQAPEGKDVIVALLTKDKLALKEYVDTRPRGAPPLTWKETFALLGNPQLEQAVKTRGQGERRQDKALVETDWQAAVLSSEAVSSCAQLRRQ